MMSVEINGSSNRVATETLDSSKVVQRQNDATSSPNTLTGKPDTFSMTDKASQMQALEAQIASLPVVDTQKVQDVQHALSTGTHRIEPPVVADKMLQFEAGLADVS